MALPQSVMKMRDLLLRARVVDELQMRAALARLEQWGGLLPTVLADLGMVDEEQVTQTIATALRMPTQLLGNVTRDAQALARLDASFCEQRIIFPLALNSRTNTFTMAVADPLDIDLVDLVASKVNARVQVVVASESQIRSAIAKHYRGHGASASPTNPSHARRPTSELPRAGAGPLEIELDLAPPPAVAGPMAAMLRAPPSANTLLDEMLGEDERERGFSEEELARLGSLRLTQQKTQTIIRALLELLREKGYPV
jgi:Type II secretion system (T2SS), protein E, N-terminal domain